MKTSMTPSLSNETNGNENNHVINNVHEKKKAESQDRRNFESVRALFVICTRVTTLQSCHNFARALHENAIVFSNQKRVIFFMHVINSIKRRGVYFIFRDSSEACHFLSTIVW